jgi:hypothetical protein
MFLRIKPMLSCCALEQSGSPQPPVQAAAEKAAGKEDQQAQLGALGCIN